MRGESLALNLARVLSQETASSLSGSIFLRGFARKTEAPKKSQKSGANRGMGKPLPPSQQLKLPDQTLKNLEMLLDPNFKAASPDPSPEEAERWRQLQRSYSRYRMAELRARQRHLSELIRLKGEALQALPPALRAPAELPDDAPFPLLRPLPTHTPPIEDYQERVLGLEAQANSESEINQFFGGQKRR